MISWLDTACSLLGPRERFAGPCPNLLGLRFQLLLRKWTAPGSPRRNPQTSKNHCTAATFDDFDVPSVFSTKSLWTHTRSAWLFWLLSPKHRAYLSGGTPLSRPLSVTQKGARKFLSGWTGWSRYDPKRLALNSILTPRHVPPFRRENPASSGNVSRPSFSALASAWRSLSRAVKDASHLSEISVKLLISWLFWIYPDIIRCNSKSYYLSGICMHLIHAMIMKVLLHNSFCSQQPMP